MTKKLITVAQQIYKELLEGDTVQCAVKLQERPWTAVELVCWHPEGGDYRALGFSKANWSDQWNADYRADLAVIRACHSLALKLEAAGVEFVSSIVLQEETGEA